MNKYRVALTSSRALGIAGGALLALVVAAGDMPLKVSSAQAADTPKRGGTLTVALNRPIRGFDHLAVPRGGMARQQVIFAVHERLFDRNWETGDLIPQLGTKAEHNDDYTVWRVTLRDDAKFSNGKPLTAEAYEYHFKRLFDSPMGSNFKGEFGAPITKVVAAGKHVVEFHFAESAPTFPVVMTDNLYLWTLSEPGYAKAHGKDKGYSLTMVGAGPYMVKEFIPRKRIVLVRNPYYYAPERQYLDQIVFIPHPGPEPVRLRGILAGDYDAMATRGSGYVFAEKQKGIDIIYGSRVSTSPSLNFNVAKPPFNDIRVRRALNLSLDREAMAKILSNNWKGAMMGNSMFARASRWYCPDVQYPKQNLAEARRLLKEYGKPVKAVIHSGGLTTFLKYSEVVQQFASKVGIELEIKNVGRGIANIVAPIHKGIVQAWTYSYGNVADPLQVQSTFRSDNPANTWHIKSAKIDAAIDKLKAARGFKARHAANCNLQRAFHEELPFLYGLESRNGIFKKPYVKGLEKPHTTLYMWHRAWIDKG